MVNSRSPKGLLLIAALALWFLTPHAAVAAVQSGPPSCDALDTSEFGLISDGSISEPWSEVELLEKYGPPCYVIPLGEVFIKRSYGKIYELGPVISRQDKVVEGEVAIKKQYVYTGDYTSPTSIITVVGGVVVKKERLY